MVLYVQSADPPTTTEPLTTSTTPETTTDPLTTTMTTGIGVALTEQLQGTLDLLTEDMNNTTSGTLTLFNLNYLTVIALLSLWYVSQ